LPSCRRKSARRSPKRAIRFGRFKWKPKPGRRFGQSVEDGSRKHCSAAAPATSRPQSLTGSGFRDNRFLDTQKGQFSRPFIFGIDDALLGAMIGPIVQALPQLMNSANQKRVQMKQADNKLMSDIISDINRRRLLEQLVQAQPAPVFRQPMRRTESAHSTASADARGAATDSGSGPAATPQSFRLRLLIHPS